MKHLNELWFRVIEIKSKGRCVVLPKLRDTTVLAELTAPVKEDFYRTDQVRLLNLKTGEYVETATDVTFTAYTVKRTTPAEQPLIAMLKQGINGAIKQAKVKVKQYKERQKLEHQIQAWEYQVQQLKKTERETGDEMDRLMAQAQRQLKQSLADQWLEQTERELVHYNFHSESNVGKDIAMRLLETTDKDIYYRAGFAYRGAQSRPITREEALDTVKGAWFDVNETETYVLINTYSVHDMD